MSELVFNVIVNESKITICLENEENEIVNEQVWIFVGNLICQINEMSSAILRWNFLCQYFIDFCDGLF